MAAPATVREPVMTMTTMMTTQRRRRRWGRRVALGVVAVVSLAALGVVAAAQPAVANTFGYALPGTHGLPGHFSYQSVWYTDPVACADGSQCLPGGPTRDSRLTLANDGSWPLRQVATLPTLFGSPHPIYEPVHDLSMAGAGTPYVTDAHPWMLYIEDPSAPGWYYVYQRPGGP